LLPAAAAVTLSACPLLSNQAEIAVNTPPLLPVVRISVLLAHAFQTPVYAPIVACDRVPDIEFARTLTPGQTELNFAAAPIGVPPLILAGRR
jgi:hypothetical protein